MSNVYDYFFEINQLFLMQSLPSKEAQAALYDPSLSEGRDIRLVVDYLAKPFTPASQLAASSNILLYIFFYKKPKSVTFL